MLSFLGLLSLAGASVLSGGQLVEVLEVEHVDLVFTDFDDMAPPPPPKGVENGATQEAPPEAPEAEPEPQVEPEPEAEPEPEPEPAVVDLSAPAGDPLGHDLGVEGGDATRGRPGGQLGGGGDSTQPGGSGVKTVASSDVRAKRQIAPVYPTAARELGLEGTCSLRFQVDARGRVSSVDVVSCPTAFQDAALDAAQRWTFYPYKDSSGTKHPASFILRLEFQLE